MDALKDELEPADFSVDPIDSYVVAEGLLEYWEVQFIVCTSGCQGVSKTRLFRSVR